VRVGGKKNRRCVEQGNQNSLNGMRKARDIGAIAPYITSPKEACLVFGDLQEKHANAPG